MKYEDYLEIVKFLGYWLVDGWLVIVFCEKVVVIFIFMYKKK